MAKQKTKSKKRKTARKKKNKGGRPTKYNVEMNEQATKLCLLGAKDSELATFFNVSESTINKWKLDHPKFSESLRLGKDDADAEVAQSLYKTALAGNTTAQIFWLKNRRSSEWRDKQEIDHTNDGKPFEPTRIVFEG